MPLPVYRLRRLLAVIAILLTLAVAGMYFYARSRATNAINRIPAKIGYGIKQTAEGFQFSKSDGKRTLFTIQASNVKEFKLNGNAELHNVSIVLYGRDSSRFDQIYGDDFAFNQKTGDVTAKGEVQIDLVANPAGLASPDQSAPKDLKSPIHLKTRDLVFNKDSGNAWTDARVEFRTPQASGWAVGVKYAGKTNTLTLASQIHIELSGPDASVIEATHGIITNDPRQIVLAGPRLSRSSGTVRADEATFYLGRENHVERVLATGDVTTELRTISSGSSGEKSTEIHGRADQAEFLLPGGEDLLRTATLSGKVHFEQVGVEDIQGEAGRVIFDFAGENQLQKVHAVDGAHLLQKMAKSSGSADKNSGPQNFDLSAPVIDFTVANGRVLKQAMTSGAARITLTQAQDNPAAAQPDQQTVVTAGKFLADFNSSGGKNHLTSVRGAPEVRIANSVQGEPDRVSTSDSVDAAFFPQGGIESITQKGNVTFSDNQPADKRMQAWANSGRYTPADHILLLTGNPRVADGGMATTANTIRINRATGQALAEGDVKSTYSELKEQPGGALLAASSPIHVTARSMTAHKPPASVATYTGNARLWQDANVIEAPSIQFDREHRSVVAEGSSAKPAQTVLVQMEKPSTNESDTQHGAKMSSLGRSSPITITAKRLSYVDSDRKVHYEGGVFAKGADFTASSRTADAYLLARSQTTSNQALSAPGKLDRMVAQGDVLIQQTNRRAQGQTLTYTAADDKFVLTGGPPSIFDAEQGKITGVSLTFFRRDDRVLVEGKGNTPVVTTTRVAR
ncbi:MAG: LPS export ABC transporter periplasmic protein LptC [Acidobacteriia bacterium]|nr:LPS export ABC transporter periplasmic protein LptC [Terriglobia bacterium]